MNATRHYWRRLSPEDDKLVNAEALRYTGPEDLQQWVERLVAFARYNLLPAGVAETIPVRMGYDHHGWFIEVEDCYDPRPQVMVVDRRSK